jgi:hypothetical protein
MDFAFWVEKNNYDVGSRDNFLPLFMETPLLVAFFSPSVDFGHTGSANQ